ncbi:MAG: TetR/AcrR family transcriptional regulator [Micrococcales bacterium]|nr:TetR/AcrR family transcriptional regulator [Micrococcales bacterium]
MPRISAPTVREHSERVRTALVDAAEEILRTEGPEALTAGAVASAAGIARNSVYRHIESVDDLRALVLARHLPRWQGAIDAALAPIDDPRERILTWCRVNLEQADESGHGWLMALARGGSAGPATARAVDHAHRSLEDLVLDEWRRLAPAAEAVCLAEITRSIVDAGFRRLDADDDPGLVTTTVMAAVAAILDARE